MTHWKHTLNIKNIWENDGMSVEEKGLAIAGKIRQTFPVSWFDWLSDDYDEELENITEAFENITGYDDTSSTQEFDGWMEEFYNYGDNGHMCWIRTIA